LLVLIPTIIPTFILHFLLGLPIPIPILLTLTLIVPITLPLPLLLTLIRHLLFLKHQFYSQQVVFSSADTPPLSDFSALRDRGALAKEPK
jgi:hypothetical protein